MITRHLARTMGPVGLLFLLFLGPDRALAQGSGCIAAECVPPNFNAGSVFGGFFNGDYIPGQTFEPLFPGALDEVRLGLYSTVPNDTTRVVVEIRSVIAGFPTGMILAQALVPGAPYAAGQLHSAYFANQQLVLEPGTQYAITLRGLGPRVIYILGAFPACNPASGSREPVHSYDGGLTWGYAWQPGERSFVYQVCMDAATTTTRSSWGRIKAQYR